MTPEVLFLSTSGSHAYGTNVEGSDVDLFGIYVPRAEAIFGLASDALPAFDATDVRFESLRHWAAMVVDKNAPDMAEALFWDPVQAEVFTSWMQRIHQKRSLFLSRALVGGYLGYSDGMGKRALGRRAKDPVDAAKSIMHGIRTAQMAYELATAGQYSVRRPNAEFLVQVRKGEVPFEEALTIHHEVLRAAETARDHSALPERADRGAVSQLLSEITIEVLYQRGELAA